MIRKYVFGSPLPTDAVVKDLPAEAGSPEPFTLEIRPEGSVSLRLSLHPEEVLFGLGESVRGMDKRGFRYESWNSDIFSHTENQASLYGSHNMLIFFNPERILGIYVDDPGRVIWDLGFTRRDTAEIRSENGSFVLYIVQEDSLKAVAAAFRDLTGRSYLPPRWAFGYIQSRWGYASEKEVRNVAAEHRKRHIPLDALCLDIDYMENYQNFTWRREAFPDLKAFQDAMRKEHLRLIPIIDAGIPAEPGNPVYESGKAIDAFCKKADGTDFIAAVWPGRCVFPDFLRPDVRKWFGDQYAPLLEAGIEGFWNDMNEPALFWSDEGLENAFRLAESLRNRPGREEAWSIGGAFSGLANSMEDYRRFCHRIEGCAVRHDRVHNLYGAGMTRATAEAQRRFSPGKRSLLFSRASFAGAHRWGGIWMGDNSSWWSHLKLALQMLPGLNLSGFLFCGCDLGGFSCDTTEDLLERFLELGVFLPLMRNHSALHTRDQEIYRFSIWETMRDTLTVRYALIPWLYSEFMKAALRGGMLFRPLAFDYPEDRRAVHVQDQVMLGEDAMIAPVLEQNANGRHIYLPEDMLLIRFRSASDYDLLPLPRGDHWIDLALGEFPLLVRRNRAVLLCPGGESTDELDDTRFTALGWITEPASCALYRDDGLTPDPDLASGLTVIPLMPLKGMKHFLTLQQ